MAQCFVSCDPKVEVSMKSGLEGRNNWRRLYRGILAAYRVSMKSGLEGRNNRCFGG